MYEISPILENEMVLLSFFCKLALYRNTFFIKILPKLQYVKINKKLERKFWSINEKQFKSYEKKLNLKLNLIKS